MGFEPVHVRARFDGHVFVPETPVDVPEGTVWEGWVSDQKSVEAKPAFGNAKGKIHMADDFDDPIEGFAEYL